MSSPGFWSRFKAIFNSNVNDLLSKSEDPEKMLNQVVLDMTEQLNEAKKQVAVAITEEKKLGKMVEQETANAAEWERRAMLAIRSGDDGLAKEALLRKKEHDGLANTYREQWQKFKTSVDQLKMALRVLNSKIEEAKRKKAVLIARKKRAEAQKAIQDTMSGLNNTSAFDTFDRMSAKIDQIEAEADAAAELHEQGTGDTLAHRFDQLEATAGADDELLTLKRKMGLAPPEPPKPQPGQVRVPGAPPDEVPMPELSKAEQDELAAALAELEAEEKREQARMKR
jgi:phage shock protein A